MYQHYLFVNFCAVFISTANKNVVIDTVSEFYVRGKKSNMSLHINTERIGNYKILYKYITYRKKFCQVVLYF